MPFDATAWQQAAEGSRDLEAPPDAEYDVELTGTKIATRQSDGAQWVVLSWRALAGPHRDRTWESMHTLDGYKPDGETNPGLSFTIEALTKMGAPVDELRSAEDVDSAVEQLRGGAFAVEVKRSGSFTNTYPRRRLEQVAASLPGSGGYGQPPAGAGNAIYGGDPPPATAQTTRAELEGRAPERTGESDVPAPGPDEFAQPEPADDDVPWTGDEPPKREDTNPVTGKAFDF